MAKVYTAQEMREMATVCQDNADCLLTDVEAEGGCTCQPLCKNDVNEYSIIAAMLRQAADAEDKLAKLQDELKDAKMTCSTEKCPFDLDTLKDANDGLYNEVKSLKARLTAVVKECETEKSKWIPAMEYESVVKRSSMVDRYDRILRAARGEAENENK